MPEHSLPDMLARRAALEPDRPAARARNSAGKWIDLSWRRLDERRRAVAAGLISLGVKRGDRVAVVSPNSIEMLLAEAAILTAGAVSTPIFPDYAPDTLLYCVADCGARIALVGSAAQQHRLRSAGLERIVVLDNAPLPEHRALPLQELETAADASLPEPRRDDLAFILYTSGTTGRPKGVELSHWNILSQQAAMSQIWQLSEKDVFLNSLPWHHGFGALFERMMALWHRALLVLDDSRGRDLDRLLQNFSETKPTLYFGVPRVFGAIAGRARRDKKARKAIFHPGFRFIFSAAANLGEGVSRFFEENGVAALEGWGLSEASPCVTASSPEKARAPGAVGWPLPGTTVKLEPRAEFSGDALGEVLVRGPQVMRGYHRRPEDTERVLREGWLHTGDLAEWTEHGLRLHGRADGIFMLANGERVSSGDLEARILAATPLLEQAVVLGPGQTFPTALCFIAPGPSRRFLADRELDAPVSPHELAHVPELRRAIVEALQAMNSLSNIPYERIRCIALVADAPAIETGELTPSLMMVRAVSAQRHAGLVAAMREDKPDPNVLQISRL